MDDQHAHIGREDLMRAPNRKRKTAEECRMPRVIKMMWDVDSETTATMMDDVGVGMLMDVDEDVGGDRGREAGPRPTPPTTLTNTLVPPGAPRPATSNPAHVTSNPAHANHSYTLTDAAVLKSLRELHSHDSMHQTCGALAHFQAARENKLFDWWRMLSDETMLSVLCWLPKATLARCARVSRRWNRVVLDESLWRRLDLGGKTLRRGVIGQVLERGVMVLRLAKAEIQMPLYSGNAMFSRPRVQYLDLSMATVELQCLEQLLSLCCVLRKLSLENCPVNDAICRHIGQNRSLVALNLCMCAGLTDSGLVPICNNLQRLDELNVGWTSMSRGAIVYLVTCLPPSLTKLNLSGNRDSLTDEDVQQLVNSCPHLRELDLSDAARLTGESVGHVVAGLAELEYLALSRCYAILPSSFALLGSVPTLLAFDVFSMLKEAALTWLRETLSNVAHINQYPFSSIARPTTGVRRTSIWGLRVNDSYV